MARCRNCGAEYDDALRQCPYCGAENLLLTHREYQSQVEEIEKKRRALPHLPRQIVRIWSSRAGKVLTILVALILVIGIGGAVIGGITTAVNHKTEPARQEKHLAALDELLSERDYDGIGQYIKDNDLLSGRVYAEYWDVYLASFPLTYVNQCREVLAGGSVWKFMLAESVGEAVEGISDIDESLAGDVFVRGGDAAMEEIRDELYAFLYDDLGMTEAEVGECFELYEATGGDYAYDDAVMDEYCAAAAPALARKGIALTDN